MRRAAQDLNTTPWDLMEHPHGDFWESAAMQSIEAETRARQVEHERNERRARLRG